MTVQNFRAICAFLAGIKTDTIAEATPAAGVTVDSVLLKDGGATIADGGVLSVLGSGATGAGAVVQRIGPTATEGLELVVFDAVVSPAAIETAVVTVPAGALLMSVQSNVEADLTGGGTTDSYGLGVAADPDLFGSSALTQNSKTNLIVGTVSATAIPILLTGTASETADGDTALTVGEVRCRVVYWQANSLDDAAA